MTVDGFYAAVAAAESREAREMTADEFHAHQTRQELEEIGNTELMEQRVRVTPRRD